MYLALAAVLVAAALFVIVLAAWAGMLDRPIGVARRIVRRLHERIAARWNRYIVRHHRIFNRHRDMGDDDEQKG